MIRLLMLTTALCVPLSPQADQARLVEMLRDGVTVVQRLSRAVRREARVSVSTVVTVSNPKACLTNLMVQPQDDHLSGVQFDWSRRGQRVARDGRDVSISWPMTVGDPDVVTIRFGSDASAIEAERIFHRLDAACAPQA